MSSILHYFDFLKPKANTAIHPEYKTMIKMNKKDKDNFLKQFYQSVFSGSIIKYTEKERENDLKRLGLKIKL